MIPAGDRMSLKIIALVLAIAAVAVAVFLFLASQPAVPDDYRETVKTGGTIESEYLKDGPYGHCYLEQAADEDFKKYEVWYPDGLADSDDKHPAIVVLNGTGVKASKYASLFEHYASWGFIAVGTEEDESWDAEAADKSLAFLISQNEDKDSVLYGKVDLDNVGATGHSQGGAGVFNAVTAMEHSDVYKTAVSLSPTNEEQSASLKWSYDLTKIDIPTLMLAGTEGDFEMKLVIPYEKMDQMFDKIDAPKCMARKTGCEHGDMLYSADGYVTAWFMWRLQGDERAAAAFTGENPEILVNELYQNQRSSL